MEKPIEKAKNVKYSGDAGLLLISSGICVPAISILVTVIVSLSDPDMGLIIFATLPIIATPVWVLPIIGGVFAIKKKHYNFVLATSIINLLYFPLFFLTIWALVLTIKSKKEFVKK